MHLFTALVFTLALWLTDINLGNTAAAVAGRTVSRDTMSPGCAGLLMALAWGLFFYLVHP